MLTDPRRELGAADRTAGACDVRVAAPSSGRGRGGRRGGGDEDAGQLTLLVIGFVAVAALLVLVAVDASKVFLARRALSSAADAAALAAVQAVDRDAIYAGAARCGGVLPLDDARASSYADASLVDDEADLRHTFAALDAADTQVRDGTVTVHLSGAVAVPFGRALAMLLPGHADGRVHVDVTAHAQAPLTAPGGC